MEDLNQEERDQADNNVDTDESNSQAGDEANMTLNDFNESRGTQFKDWDSAIKSGKEADKAFAKGEHKNTVQSVTEVKESILDTNEIVYLDNKPEAKAIWEDVKARAEAAGVDPIAFYNADPILQKHAKDTFTEAQQESENKNKIESPSSIIGSTGKTDFSKVTDESYSDLSDSDKVKFNKYMIEKEKAGN